ncbi:Hypothetical predicted protein [Xyrichtys novacula]|uniref:Uncharacterized protein n=1 Tax=Xyrichtys novacula TaxID=13765 RepID=A0AAV1EVF0_XYRNO|nr:Hypothetical predicted protein [Xyrichtys novacula]
MGQAAQKRRLLRQHMASEECGLRGGRSSTCMAAEAGPLKNSRCTAIWTLTPFFCFTQMSKQGREHSAKRITDELSETLRVSEVRAHLLNWFTCCEPEACRLHFSLETEKSGGYLMNKAANLTTKGSTANMSQKPSRILGTIMNQLANHLK